MTEVMQNSEIFKDAELGNLASNKELTTYFPKMDKTAIIKLVRMPHSEFDACRFWMREKCK